MRSRYLPLLLGLALLPLAQLLYPGCATLFGGPRQDVLVKSKPAGAVVRLNGRRIGVTPVTTFVSRWGFHRIRIELAGYEPYEVKLEKHYNEMATANVFIGGGTIVIDALTGSIFDLDVPKSEQKKMLSEPWKEGDLTASLTIYVGLHPVGPARKVGQMVRRGR